MQASNTNFHGLYQRFCISPLFAGDIFIKTNPVVIPFCTNSDAYILNGYVEADYDRVDFDEDITCTGGDIPIVGMFK